MVDLVKSFHEDMKARLRVDGELLDEIEVTNGLRQGYTMAPTLLNLYAAIVPERWLDKIEPLDGIGTLVVNKQDGLLFRGSTRNAQETMLYKGEFAYNVVLLAWSREAACTAINAYVEVASSLGLTESFPFMVIGPVVSEDDWQPLAVDEGLIEWVDRFPYLGSVIGDKGKIDAEVDKRMANASRAFGALYHSVFCDYHLSITKPSGMCTKLDSSKC